MAGETAQIVWRVVKRLVALFVLIAVVAALWFAVGSVSNRLFRGGVAIVMALGIFWLGVGYFAQLGNPPPPEPPPTDVHPGLRLAYLCEMCGLELAVVKVAKDRAPRHCGEAMTLTRRER